MATAKVTVEFKPDAHSTLEDLKTHMEVLEVMLDVTVTDASDVKLELGVVVVDADYGDDEKPVVVTTWDV